MFSGEGYTEVLQFTDPELPPNMTVTLKHDEDWVPTLGQNSDDDFISVSLDLGGTSNSAASLRAKLNLVVSDDTNKDVVGTVRDPGFKDLTSFQEMPRELSISPNHGIPTLVTVMMDVMFEKPLDKECLSVSHKAFFSKLSDIVASSELTDVVLVTNDDKSFSSHRLLLAAHSDVFRVMFSHKGTQETTSGIVHIKDMTSRVVEVFLGYLGNGKIDWETNSDIAGEILAAGDKYNAQGLKEAASRYLAENCTVDNCLEALVVADLHGDKEILTAATQVLKENMSTLVGSAKWEALRETQPKIFESILVELLRQ